MNLLIINWEFKWKQVNSFKMTNHQASFSALSQFKHFNVLQGKTWCILVSIHFANHKAILSYSTRGDWSFVTLYKSVLINVSNDQIRLLEEYFVTILTTIKLLNKKWNDKLKLRRLFYFQVEGTIWNTSQRRTGWW